MPLQHVGHSRDDQFELAQATAGKYQAICSWRRPVHNETVYVVPVRVLEGVADSDRDDSSTAEVVTQTERLGHKIAALDTLSVSDVQFARQFAPGRVFVVGPNAPTSPDAWRLGEATLQAIATTTGMRLVSQTDYDQRRLHPYLGGILDALDFETKHDPSASATVVAFEEVLGASHRSLGDARIGLRGLGDLGSRIARMLTDRGAQVFASDIDASRFDAFDSCSRLVETNPHDLDLEPCDAHIFCANSGSLSVPRAERLLQNASLRAVGGPEAGLDRSTDAQSLVAGRSIDFVPSMLCGSLGLVANLEEILGHVTESADREDRFRSVVRRIVYLAGARVIPFHAACYAILTGESR
jgi:hypothetical protein